VTVVPTFLGAHALPAAYAKRRAAYVRLVCKTMIPRVARLNLAEFCDVFVEEGAFTAAEGEEILRAGLAHGLKPKVHADEMGDGGGRRARGPRGRRLRRAPGRDGPAGYCGPRPRRRRAGPAPDDEPLPAARRSTPNAAR